MYGYASDPFQKWEKLVVLYASTEPIGPSFLESALIQKYKGALFLSIKTVVCHLPVAFNLNCLS